MQSSYKLTFSSHQLPILVPDKFAHAWLLCRYKALMFSSTLFNFVIYMARTILHDLWQHYDSARLGERGATAHLQATLLDGLDGSVGSAVFVVVVVHQSCMYPPLLFS